MLTSIHIKNFAIIKELELDLQPEMTCLTGETGAGKSIIVDSLELALGARVDTSLICDHGKRSEITITFDIIDMVNLREWLATRELVTENENECIMRRVISEDGRSRCSINGRPCTQQTLRDTSHFLLNIHGQHEHQNLLNADYQLRLLDAFAASGQLASRVKNLYSNWLKIKQDLVATEKLLEGHESKIDFLNYQLQEFATVDFSLESIESLRREQKRLHHMEQFTNSVSSALDLLAENDGAAIINSLYHTKNQLEIGKNIDPKISSSIDLINNAIIQVEEAIVSLRQNLHTMEGSDEHQKQIEEQLTSIYTLARKHQTQPEQLLLVQSNLDQQLKTLQHAVTQFEKIKLEEQEAEKAYLVAATELTNIREFAAAQLNQLVSTKMQALGMADGKFSATLVPNLSPNFSAHGLEQVEFLVSTNPGHPLQPLRKVASGGELSRISLAIQVITAEKEVTPTLIFDEIDAGIGGKTADIVGQLLQTLAMSTQVICITHLPQIAAKGQHHILVEKMTNAKNTEITLKNLTKPERVAEIARMLGGIKITKQTLAHAEEMLQ